MINFYNEDIQFKLKNKSILKQWIASIIEKNPPKRAVSVRAGKYKVGKITFVFCSDDYLLMMNKEYLKHDTYTDIITFDYTEKNETQFPLEKGSRGIKLPTIISGDIFISIDRVKENATKFSKSFEEELHRVIIHGVLHLLGYKDKTKVSKAEMTKQEDACLKLLKSSA